MIRKFYLSPEGDGGTGAGTQNQSEEQKAAAAKAAEEAATKAKSDEEAKKSAEEAEKAKKEKKEENNLTEEEKQINSLKEKVEKGESLAENEIEILKKAGYEIEEKNEEEETKIEFWNKLKTQVGEVEEFDYTSDITPDNIAAFSTKLVETELINYEKTLEERFPKEYLALRMRANGEDPSSLYSEKQSLEFAEKELKKGDEERAKNIIRTSLKSKQVSESDITDLIEVLEEKGKILERGESERKYLLDSEKDRLKNEEIKLNEKKAKIEQDKKIFVNNVSSFLQKGDIDNLKIPDKDKGAFAEFFINSIQYDNGKFKLVKDVTNDNILDLLKSEFYSYRKGNIIDLIKTESKKLYVKKLTTDGKENKSVPKGGNDNSGTKPKILTLADIPKS